jgi:anthraniloyl-CoA monooxygenase
VGVTTEALDPPSFPTSWTASYVSYWQPALPDDLITSGTVWFDYDRDAFRIDGLFNPWSETEHGYRLWLSEVNRYGARTALLREVRYTHEGDSYRAQRVDTEAPSQGCLVPRTVLRDRGARVVEAATLLGFTCVGWDFVDERRRPVRYYMAENARLVRMVTGNPGGRASVRDFPTWSSAPIPNDVFAADGTNTVAASAVDSVEVRGRR